MSTETDVRLVTSAGVNRSRPRLHLNRDHSVQLRLPGVDADTVRELVPDVRWGRVHGLWVLPDRQGTPGLLAEAAVLVLATLAPGPSVGWDLRPGAELMEEWWLDHGFVPRRPGTTNQQLRDQLEASAVRTYETL